MIVKRGDTFTVTFTVTQTVNGVTSPVNLTGAAVAVHARLDGTQGATIVLAATVTDAINGVISHALTGTLAAGTYDVETKVTSGGVTVSYPTDGFETLVVTPDLS